MDEMDEFKGTDLLVSATLNDKCLHRLFKWLNARFSLIAVLETCSLTAMCYWRFRTDRRVNCTRIDTVEMAAS